jgi:hypothetical protein
MDISKASNFERFVFDLLGRDAGQTRALFQDALNAQGYFDLSGHPAFADARARYGFVSGKSTHANRLATIRDTFERFGVTIDTHTADGLKVAREHAVPGQTVVVLETALPIKFAETIREALGCDPERPAKFNGIEALPKRFQVLPVGRVSGELPAGAGAVEDIYAFNLMTSLHQGDLPCFQINFGIGHGKILVHLHVVDHHAVEPGSDSLGRKGMDPAICVG